ncbi:MAG: LysM peptidoglycan-binding domain-containing protein [Candidatus Amulumruptor caecigallinarius]|nr:LysM peptidoglycan-binding domain-containing protein [Candidatus Amulumruptor caecigallinarius]MCM1397772.1 LysM peptidoglycan-binding domain-containing protein [Candidatus Amulumruptor caecigallinarius]MCM1454812.1 LysM peptidoglycan-binding domain-containing protein [bacterium]
MKRIFASLILLGAASWGSDATAQTSSILDIKHSLTDDNIVPPESFETKTRELEENFYLHNYATGGDSDDMPQKLGTPAEYEKRLSQLPSEIEMPYNSVVGKYIDMYVGKRRGMVSNLLALHNYYGNIFLEELEKEGMPTELQYLPIIESALKPNAVSRVGAAGLWQFMPATARGLGMEVNSLVDERRDPRSSSRNAARYLKELYGIYGDWSLAIAAYNCGPGNVNKALRRAGGGKKDFWEIYRFLPAETRGYVPAFIAANYAMNYYKEHNITPRVVTKHLVTDTVLVNKRVHFNQIAGVLNIPVDEIRMLNPQYRKDVIPGDVKPYPLVLPSQQVLSYVMSEPQILAYDEDIYKRRTYVEPRTAEEGDLDDPLGISDPGAIQPDMAQSLNATENFDIATNFTDKPVKKVHTVARGENLRDIARRYGVSATDIKHWNNLRRGKVKEGDQLVIETYESGLAATTITPRADSDVDSNLTAGRTAVPAPRRRADDAAMLPAVPVPAPKQETAQATVPEPPARQQTAAQEQSTKPAVPQRRVYGEGAAADSYVVSGASKKQARKREQAAPEHDSNVASPKKGVSTENKGAKEKPAKVGNSGGKKSQNAKKGKNSKADNKKKGKSKSYTVKSGDSLEKIARRNGTTVSALQKANGIKGSNIRAGQKITIPGK